MLGRDVGLVRNSFNGSMNRAVLTTNGRFRGCAAAWFTGAIG